jgi:chromosome partitioning protein
MTLITSIASKKGGVAKTTTAISLAAGLARKGHTTLLIDIDEQANSSEVLVPISDSLTKDQTVYATIIDRKPLVIHPTPIPELFIVPAHIDLGGTDVELATALDNRAIRLKTQLDKIKNQYEYVIIDCPPDLGWLTINALAASDQAISPISPGRFELGSIVDFEELVEKVIQNYNSLLRIRGYLYTRGDATVSGKECLITLRQRYPALTFKTIIPSNVDVRDASIRHLDVFGYKPQCVGAQHYMRLIQEVFHV